MREPTHKQYLALEKTAESGSVYKTNKEDDIDLYWGLVRGGYLHNLVVLSGNYDWRFVVTDKGYEYLKD